MTSPGDRGGFGRNVRRSRSSPAVVYVVPAYGWDYLGADQYPIDQYPTTPSYPYPGPQPPPAEEEAPPPIGYVSLELETGVNPQVYVDGSYFGTLDDLEGVLTLNAGVHYVELRAEGYESVAFSVQVLTGRTVTYRGTLPALATVVPPASPEPASAQGPAQPPATIYFVPGCYVGNVPPRDADLPAGCDGSRTIRFAPRP